MENSIYSDASLLGFEIVKLGHEALRKTSLETKDIHFKSSQLMNFIGHMERTLSATEGVGLAAPQVSVNYQLFITSIPQSCEERYILCKSSPFKVLINPSYEVTDSEVLGGIEGCLSIPGFVGRVLRPKKITAKAFDENGQEFVEELVGWNARIFLHEYDHLYGKMYIDKLSSNSKGNLELYESSFWKTLEDKKRQGNEYKWLENRGLKP